jgi:hypothetical protein
MPAAGGQTLFAWMFLLGFVVDIGALQTDFDRMAVMVLLGRHELDASVTLLVVVPSHERRHPLAGLVFAGERPVWVFGSVLDLTDQRSQVAIVVTHLGR